MCSSDLRDSAQILVEADIFPGAKVVEAGVGSGGLSSYLLRAIGPTGSLTSFERRADFADTAKKNVAAFMGHIPDNWSVLVGDLQEGVPPAVEIHGTIDRVILDMLAPWECIDAAHTLLRPGGVLCIYVATTTQLSRVAETLRITEKWKIGRAHV